MDGPELCWTLAQQYVNVMGPEVGPLGESEGRTGTEATLAGEGGWQIKGQTLRALVSPGKDLGKLTTF